MMIHTLLQLAAALAGSPAAEPPQADPMASFYGNTLTVTVPDAFYYFAKRYIEPDGTWREPKGDGFVRGVWRLENGQVCTWQTEPAIHDPTRYCYAPTPRKVGDEWTSTDQTTGNLVIQRLEPGRP